MPELPIVDASPDEPGEDTGVTVNITHSCEWHYSGHKHLGEGSSTFPLSLNPARTVVILRCSACGDIKHYVVPGHWTRRGMGL